MSLSNEEFRKVWQVRDYGNLDALMALRGGGSGGSALLPKDAEGRTLFPEGMPTGRTTETT